MFILKLEALLSLMAILSTFALSLKTGYDYDTDASPTPADQYSDLKCGYMFAGVTHMRLVKLILEETTSPSEFPVGLVNFFKIREVICTLYDVKSNREIVEVGSLWLLLLYVSAAYSYSDRLITDSVSEAVRVVAVERLKVTLDYVVGKMQNELKVAGCRPGNQFDSYEKRYMQLKLAEPHAKPNLIDIRKEALKNCEELNSLLIENNAHSTYGKRCEALKSRQLFLNNLGVNKVLKNKLMTGYDVQVSWDSTFEMLKADYQYAFQMYSPTVNVLPLVFVKKYYSGVFSLFKCITYRLTWKFLLYVNMLTGKRREMHLKKWHDLLADIETLLGLQDDPEIKALLVAIKKQGSVDISNQLETNLTKINGYLQCVATEQMILKPNEFPSTANPGTTDLEEIDWYSVNDAQNFIADLRNAFQKVDFGVIRSIVKYINDESKW